MTTLAKLYFCIGIKKAAGELLWEVSAMPVKGDYMWKM